jgi:protein O-GlcNAc transferase
LKIKGFLAIIEAMPKTFSYICASVLLSFILWFIAGCADNSQNVEYFKATGKAAFDAGKFNDAINIFKKGLRIKPSDRDLLYYTALSFKRLDILDSALVYMKRAKILYTRDREINEELIDLCAIFRDYDCALNAIAVLIASGENERKYWPALSELYYRNNDMYMAAKYCRLILAEDSSKENYYIYLSGALSQMGKFEESNEVLEKAVERFGPTAESYGNMAINYLQMGKLDKAEECSRNSLALKPDNIAVWINLANVLSESKNRAKKEEALEIYKKYYSETPKLYNLDSLIRVLEDELSTKE